MTSTTATKEDKKKFANLIGPTEPKVDREVRELLITARVGLLLKASFFGNLATRLKLVQLLVFQLVLVDPLLKYPQPNVLLRLISL